MSHRSARKLAWIPRLGGSGPAWLVGAAVGVFVLLQAVLPALHVHHHASHFPGQRVVASLHAIDVPGARSHLMDSGSAGRAARDEDGPDDSEHQSSGCEECKTLLLAKSIGGVLAVAGDLRREELVTRLAGRGPERVTIARHAHCLAARGPPANRT